MQVLQVPIPVANIIDLPTDVLGIICRLNALSTAQHGAAWPYKLPAASNTHYSHIPHATVPLAALRFLGVWLFVHSHLVGPPAT